MKLRILLTLTFLIALSAAPAMAQIQPDPTGVQDTLAIVASVEPVVGAPTSQLVLDLWVYNDEALAGATAGFSWDNPKLRMDSAVAQPTLVSGFDLARFFYEDNNIALTNANQRFLIGGARLFSSGITANPGGRRLWAKYYFTVTNWTESDAVTFDTLTFNAGSAYLFVAVTGNLNFLPTWEGSITVGNPPPPVNILTVAPASLTFSATQGGANPATQPFNVSTSGDPLAYTATKTQSWLTVNPAGGTTPQDVTASVDITGLTAGTYHDTISVAAPGAENTPQMVAVTLNLAAPPIVLVTTPDTLYFSAVLGGANPAGQYFHVSEQLDRAIAFSALENSTRLALSKTSGTTPDSIMATMSIAALAPGQYLDSVIINAPTATNSPRKVFMKSTVEAAPAKILVVSPDTLYFTAEEGGAETDAQQIMVTEQGGGAIPFTVSGANEWVLIPDTIGTTPDSVAVSVLPGSLGTGSHLFMLTVNAPDAENTPEPVYVQITITPRPRTLAVTPINLNFSGTAGVPITDSMKFVVTETGGDNIEYTVLDTTAWVSVDPAGGTTPDSSWVKVDNTGLAAGSYTTVLSVQAAGVTNSPQLVLVHLTLSPAANQAPVLDPIGPQVVDEGTQLLFTIHATDPDGTMPILTAVNSPDSALFVDSANGTGLFVWTPDYNQAGPHFVTFIASDGVLADSEVVEITVVNVNRTPVITSMMNDTTIDECMALYWFFTATDPDGDPIIMYLDQNYPNMTFVDSGMGEANFYFYPDTTQAGVYPLVLTVSDGMDSVTAGFTITVTDCTPPPGCVDIMFPDTLVQIFDTVGTPNNPAAYLPIWSSGNDFCFTISDITQGPWPTFASVDPTEGCSPDSIMVTYDKTGLPAGEYVNSFRIFGDSSVCEPNTRGFTVIMHLVDTTHYALDTLAVATVPAVPGATVAVPVNFVNHCDLYGIQALFGWNTPYLTLDSISYMGSAITGGAISDSIDNIADRVALMLSFPEGWVGPGEWLYGTMYFTLDPATPAGFYPLNLSPTPFDNPTFATDCGLGVQVNMTDFIPGGIVVDTASSFVCGYVVDPEGTPIEGATVELWGDFPVGGADMSTMSDTSGYFEFNNIAFTPFDLYGYKDGYYPGLVEKVIFNQNGIMIVLTPVEPVYPTYEWVNFYCDNDLYFGQPLPVGSVVDAYDPNGVRCGTYTVHVAGTYGFMPVYRDDAFMDGDQGAEPGDNIRFFINGVEAQAYGPTVWTANGDSWQVCLEGGEFTSECQLHEGWNLVSWRVDTESDYIEDALASIGDHIQLVLGFEQGGLTYDPNLPQFSTLWYVDHLSGYWIKVDADVTLEMQGAAVAVATPIPVTAGWNLVSYLPDQTLPIEDALQSLAGNVIVSLGFDNGGQVYLPGDSLHNTLTDMSPCMGYWVKTAANGVLLYPGAGPVVAPQVQPLGQVAKIASDVTPTTQWMNLYAEKLTLDGATVPAGSRIDAFTTSGVKIGTFTMREGGVFGFMPVYADDSRTNEIDGVRAGEQFTLTVNDQPVNETFTFTAAGDRVELFNLTAKTDNEPVLPTSFSLSQNYPNPFNPTTTISFSLPAAGKARLEVFNVLGELVATPFDSYAGAGENQVVWDGTNDAGSQVASGIYFYRLTADNYTETKKMVLMK